MPATLTEQQKRIIRLMREQGRDVSFNLGPLDLGADENQREAPKRSARVEAASRVMAKAPSKQQVTAPLMGGEKPAEKPDVVRKFEAVADPDIWRQGRKKRPDELEDDYGEDGIDEGETEEEVTSGAEEKGFLDDLLDHAKKHPYKTAAELALDIALLYSGAKVAVGVGKAVMKAPRVIKSAPGAAKSLVKYLKGLTPAGKAEAAAAKKLAEAAKVMAKKEKLRRFALQQRAKGEATARAAFEAAEKQAAALRTAQEAAEASEKMASGLKIARQTASPLAKKATKRMADSKILGRKTAEDGISDLLAGVGKVKMGDLVKKRSQTYRLTPSPVRATAQREEAKRAAAAEKMKRSIKKYKVAQDSRRREIAEKAKSASKATTAKQAEAARKAEMRRRLDVMESEADKEAMEAAFGSGLRKDVRRAADERYAAEIRGMRKITTQAEGKTAAKAATETSTGKTSAKMGKGKGDKDGPKTTKEKGDNPKAKDKEVENSTKEQQKPNKQESQRKSPDQKKPEKEKPKEEKPKEEKLKEEKPPAEKKGDTTKKAKEEKPEKEEAAGSKSKGVQQNMFEDAAKARSEAKKAGKKPKK